MLKDYRRRGRDEIEEPVERCRVDAHGHVLGDSARSSSGRTNPLEITIPMGERDGTFLQIVAHEIQITG